MPEPRILFVDIETAPIKGYAWGVFDTNLMQVETPTYMLCFAYKWAGTIKVNTRALCDYPGYKKDKENDKALVSELWHLVDKADIIVAHNGDQFDIKKSNSRFIVHGLPPPSPYKSFDTLKAARRNFKFDSNKLDNIGRYLQVGRKLPTTGKDLWLGCMTGDQRSWRMMRRYNAQDVRLLEAVYNKVKSWSRHPDVRQFTNRTGCPTCQSKRVQCRGFNVSKSQKTQKMQCQDCGQWYSGRKFKEPNVWDETA